MDRRKATRVEAVGVCCMLYWVEGAALAEQRRAVEVAAERRHEAGACRTNRREERRARPVLGLEVLRDACAWRMGATKTAEESHWQSRCAASRSRCRCRCPP